MMFSLKVSVPRITAATVKDWERQVPGLLGMVKIPVVETLDEAKAAAAFLADKQLNTTEYVHDVESVVETDAGWDITLTISGD